MSSMFEKTYQNERRNGSEHHEFARDSKKHSIVHRDCASRFDKGVETFLICGSARIGPARENSWGRALSLEVSLSQGIHRATAYPSRAKHTSDNGERATSRKYVDQRDDDRFDHQRVVCESLPTQSNTVTDVGRASPAETGQGTLGSDEQMPALFRAVPTRVKIPWRACPRQVSRAS